MSDPLDHAEDALRAAFAEGIPTPPGAPDRASGARRLTRRARRRRTTGVLAAVVAVVAAAAVVPAALDTDRRSAEPGPVDPASAAPVRIDCPRTLGDAFFAAPAEKGTDVVGARLCSGSGTGYDAPSTVIPADEAVELATLVDRQPEVTPPEACTEIGGPGYLLVIARSDGSREVVRGDLNGCGLLTFQGVVHSGTRTVLDATLSVLGHEIADEVTCAAGDARDDRRSGRLADGVIAVRLCSGTGRQDGPQAAADALTTGVEDLVDLVNISDTRSNGTTCLYGQGPQPVLLFVYGDGTTRSVSSLGCGALGVGGAIRYDDGQVLTRAVELWRAQRRASEPGDVAMPDLSCSGSIERSPLGEPFDMTTAVLCVDDLEPVAVPAAELVTLLDSLRPDGRATGREPLDCTTSPASMRLVGATAWGDRVTLSYDCGSWEIDDPDGTVARVVPGAEGLAVQDRLIAEATDGG